MELDRCLGNWVRWGGGVEELRKELNKLTLAVPHHAESMAMKMAVVLAWVDLVFCSLSIPNLFEQWIWESSVLF